LRKSNVISAACSGVSGIAPIIPVPRIHEPSGLRYTRLAQVRDFDPTPHLSTGTLATADRSAQFALISARQAAQQSNLTQHHAPHRTAIILGCSIGGLDSQERDVSKLFTHNARFHPLCVVQTMANGGASHVSIDLGITGPVFTLSTACASGTHAIGLAFQMLRSGMADAAIAGGHEAPLTFGFLRAWDSMRVVSPTQCRPFSADRDGMTLGEGAAILTLETLASAQARNAPIFAEIIGFGMSADAKHITNPSIDGATAAMRAAIADALPNSSETDPLSAANSPEFAALLDQVGYINAHGTATQANDSTEAAAIHNLLGPRAPHVPVSSTKSLHGHAIGATGAIETLATILALHHKKLPATYGTTTIDPTLNLDVITGEPRDAAPDIALTNSFAFGGINAVLALRRWQA